MFQFLASYWWLVFPFAGVIGGWAKGVAKYNERRRADKIEMLRIKHGSAFAPTGQPIGVAAKPERSTDEAIDRVFDTHDDVNERWFGYETELATLIDFPMMVDLREPLTLEFHQAKVVADDLRPADRAVLKDPATLAKYEDAVRAYKVAFEVAEREAQRRRQSDFSESERERLARARKLVSVADNDGATPAERQNAYERAKQELDGILAVPRPAARSIERKIARAIETGDSPA